MISAERTMVSNLQAMPQALTQAKVILESPAAPLKSTIYPRLIFGNSVALSER